MSDYSKWDQFESDILAKLGVVAEYQERGVRFVGSPLDNGWYRCHATGRPDRNPSANVYVGPGKFRGWYKDFGGGVSLSLFRFAAKFWAFADWREARRHFAEQAGVPFPRGDYRPRKPPSSVRACVTTAKSSVSNPAQRAEKTVAPWNPPPRPPENIDWEARVKACEAALRPCFQEEFAAHEGIPSAVFPLLRLGYDHADGSYTFPQYDAAGKCCGIVRLDLASRAKRPVYGSVPGLIIPKSWNEFDSPVYIIKAIPKGWKELDGPLLITWDAIEALLLAAIGFATIDISSIAGSTDILLQYCGDFARKREIIVLGKRNQEKGGSGPGNVCVGDTAQRLADHLRYPVKCAVPPAAYRDVRDWVLMTEPELWITRQEDVVAALIRVREAFIASFLVAAECISPSPHPVPSTLPPTIPLVERAKIDSESSSNDAAPAIPESVTPSAPSVPTPSPATLAMTEQVLAEPKPLDRRAQEQTQVEAITEVLNTPGHYVADCDQQYAVAIDVLALGHARTSLTIVPSRKEADEVAAKLCELGIDARPYPSRNEDTCNMWESKARAASEAGVPVGLAICPTCEHSKPGNFCEFMKLRESAYDSPHLVVTARRAAVKPEEMARKRETVLLAYAHPLDVLKPSREVQLGHALDRSTDASWTSESLRLVHQAADTFAQFDQLNEAMFDDVDGCPPLPKSPAYWYRLGRLAAAADTALRDGPTVIPLPAFPGQEASREAAKWLWEIISHWPKRPQGDVTTILTAAASGQLDQLAVRDGYLTAVWQLSRFPTTAVVIDLGGDTNWSLDATGVTWEKIECPRDNQSGDNVTQRFKRITSKSSMRQIGGIMRLDLMRYPGKLGVVATRRLARRIARALDKEFSPDDRARITIVGWGCNPAPLRDCATILCFGGPRQHPQAVFRRVLQVDPAAVKDNTKWGEAYDWDATDVNGRTVHVFGRRYGHPSWQAAFQEIAHGVLRRLLGEVSCPVIVISDDELDLPLATEPPQGISIDQLEALEAVRQALDARPEERQALLVSLKRPEKGLIFVEKLCSITGQRLRTVQANLAKLTGLGYLAKEGKRGGYRRTDRKPSPDEHLPKGCRAILDALDAEQDQIARSAVTLPTKVLNAAVVGSKGESNNDIDTDIGIGRATALSAVSTPLIGSLYRRAELQAALSAASEDQERRRIWQVHLRRLNRLLHRLRDLGLIQRVGYGRDTGWTLTSVAFPDAVPDPAAEAAFVESQGRFLTPDAETANQEQALLPFESSVLRTAMNVQSPKPDTQAS
jgi:hypothetical protein